MPAELTAEIGCRLQTQHPVPLQEPRPEELASLIERLWDRNFPTLSTLEAIALLPIPERDGCSMQGYSVLAVSQAPAASSGPEKDAPAASIPTQISVRNALF
jgi:hypothetical protein